MSSQEKLRQVMNVMSQEWSLRKGLTKERKIRLVKTKAKGKCGSRHSPRRAIFWR